MTCARFTIWLVFHAPGQLLPYLKAAVADPLQNISCSVLLRNVTKSLKETLNNSKQDMLCSDIV